MGEIGALWGVWQRQNPPNAGFRAESSKNRPDRVFSAGKSGQTRRNRLLQHRFGSPDRAKT